MNENSSKQVLLSVIGIAVLVVAVVGVSFAFFTYSKTGTANNTLTTGSIFFNFTEGNTINLTNQFPMADSEGESLTVASNKALSFSVSGYDTSGKGIDYTVYALPGAPVDTRNRFKDDEIKLNLQTSANGTGYSNDFSTSKLVGNLTSAGLKLATGRISATKEASKQTDTYTLRMWIDGAVTIGDAESDNYTSAEFANLYYSLKVKVVAATTGTTQPTA